YACTMRAFSRSGERLGWSSDVGALAHAVWTGGQFSLGNSLSVMPMSLRDAPITCCSRLGWFAFKPKRPRTICCLFPSQTRLGLPAVLRGEAEDRALVDRREEPEAHRLGRETGTDHLLRIQRPERQRADRIGRRAQRVPGPVGVGPRRLHVRDGGCALAGHA